MSGGGVSRESASPSVKRSVPVVRLALAWGAVGIPLAWGVWQVFLKSLALFR